MSRYSWRVHVNGVTLAVGEVEHARADGWRALLRRVASVEPTWESTTVKAAPDR